MSNSTENANAGPVKTALEIAHEKAESIIAKAQAEQAALDLLPETGVPVSVMIFRGVPHFRYSPRAFSDVLAIADALETVPAYDCKDRGCRGTYATPRGEEMGESFAWVDVSASVRGSVSVKFRFFARLSSGVVAQVSVEFDGSQYARKYNGAPWHSDFDIKFTDMTPRAYKYKEYRRDGPALLGFCSYVVTYNTGVRDGSSVQASGYFATRDCLAGILDTLEKTKGEAI